MGGRRGRKGKDGRQLAPLSNVSSCPFRQRMSTEEGVRTTMLGWEILGGMREETMAEDGWELRSPWVPPFCADGRPARSRTGGLEPTQRRPPRPQRAMLPTKILLAVSAHSTVAYTMSID